MNLNIRRFVHDCQDCTFICSIFKPDSVQMDLYHCNDSVVVRYSDNGPDYSSSEISQALKSISHPELRVAAVFVQHSKQYSDSHPDLVWF